MKKIVFIFLFMSCIFIFIGCYKQDSLDFAEGDYILKDAKNERYTFDNYELDYVKLSFNEISKTTYDSKNMQNVLKNRYSKKYYAITFVMIIEGIEYTDIKFTEIPGSSNYNNRYYFEMQIVHKEKKYDCKFRFDIYNYKWLHQIDENRANSFRCDIFEVKEKNGNIFNGASLSNFILNYSSKEVYEVNNLLRNQLGCEWLNETNVVEIAKIKIIREDIGVAPGSFKNITSSTNVDTIEKMFKNYYWLYTTPIDKKDNIIVPGGTNYIAQFILNDETIKEIKVTNGVYCDKNGDFFKLESIPQFDAIDQYETSFCFVTNNDVAEIWWSDTYICEIPISEIEFMEVELYAPTEGGIVGDWILKTEFGNLYFPESYIFNFSSDTNTNYKLTGIRLFKLVEKYSNWFVFPNGQPVQMPKD